MSGYPREEPYKSWKAEKQRLKQIEAMADEDRRLLALSEKNARYRYLPASDRAFDELVESVGYEQAALIKALVEAMIAERHGEPEQ